MKKEDLYNSFGSIGPNDIQKSRMLNGILNPKRNTVRTKPKRMLVAVITIICLMTTTVIAANISSFLNLRDKIDPHTARFIEPVEKVCINQGIKMEVVAVARYDNMVKAYITFQDLEGDRIGEDLSFLDYFGMKGSRSFGWRLIDYDEENKIATLSVKAESSTKFEGENLTFKVENIFYDNKEYEDYEIGINLTKISHYPSYIDATKKQFMSWSHGNLYGGLDSDDDIVPILTPHVIDFKFPDIKTSMISNIGVIDRKLHVQICQDTNFEGQGVNIYLKDSKGEVIDSDTQINFKIDELKKLKNPKYSYYSEYIFDIDTDNLHEYKLLGYFRTSKQLEGNWEVSFKAEDSEILELNDIDIDIKKMKIDKIGINPFGISISGRTDLNKDTDKDIHEFDVKVNTETDIIQTSMLSFGKGGELLFGSKEKDDAFIAMYKIENPIDLNLIKSITIDGIDIPIE